MKKKKKTLRPCAASHRKRRKIRLVNRPPGCRSNVGSLSILNTLKHRMTQIRRHRYIPKPTGDISLYSSHTSSVLTVVVAVESRPPPVLPNHCYQNTQRRFYDEAGRGGKSLTKSSVRGRAKIFKIGTVTIVNIEITYILTESYFIQEFIWSNKFLIRKSFGRKRIWLEVVFMGNI